MGAIVGTKRFRMVIEGEVPPDVPDEATFSAFVYGNVTLSLALGSMVRNVRVFFTDDAPGEEKPGLKLQ